MKQRIKTVRQINKKAKLYNEDDLYFAARSYFAIKHFYPEFVCVSDAKYVLSLFKRNETYAQLLNARWLRKFFIEYNDGLYVYPFSDVCRNFGLNNYRSVLTTDIEMLYSTREYKKLCYSSVVDYRRQTRDTISKATHLTKSGQIKLEKALGIVSQKCYLLWTEAIDLLDYSFRLIGAQWYKQIGNFYVNNKVGRPKIDEFRVHNYNVDFQPEYLLQGENIDPDDGSTYRAYIRPYNNKGTSKGIQLDTLSGDFWEQRSYG